MRPPPAWILLTLLFLNPLPARGQAGLDRVETLLAQGQVHQARDAFQRWWEVERPGAGREAIQRGIWLRGKMTVDADMAELDFRRLAMEYPGGPYSDDALLRLAQWAEARGEMAQARAHYRELAQAYPTSPFHRRAEDWLETNPASAGSPPAGRNPATGGTSSPILERAPTATEDRERGPVSIQLGAFRQVEGAMELASMARAAGHEPRLVRVPGSDLVRVRVGYFRTRAQALHLRRALSSGGFDSTVVTDAMSEEEVR